MAVQPTISKFFKPVSKGDRKGHRTSETVSKPPNNSTGDINGLPEPINESRNGDLDANDSVKGDRKRARPAPKKNIEKLVESGEDVSDNDEEEYNEQDEQEEQEEQEEVKPKKKKISSGRSLKGSSRLTPLDQQIKELKFKNMDKLLVVRVGYKYKCFAQDAIIASRVLHIKLVPGKLTLDDSDPQDLHHKQFAYCSFPDSRINVHLVRLVTQNLKVGIVEQVETSALKKYSADSLKSTVFERKVTTTVSKATYGINNTVDSDEKRILGDISSIWALDAECRDDGTYYYWLVSVDLNNGEVIHDEFEEQTHSTNQLELRMRYLEPVELITYRNLPDPIIRVLQRANNNSLRMEYRKEAVLPQLEELKQCLDLPAETFKLLSALFGCLEDYKNEELLLISSNYKPFSSKTHMLLNSNALESLDIFTNGGGKGSLFWVLDHTRTAFGYRQLREWISKPLLNRTDIEDRLNAIECVKEEINNIFFESLNQILKNTPDLLRTLNRIAYGRTSRKEVYFFLKQLSLFGNHFSTHSAYINAEIRSSNSVVYHRSKLLSNLLLEMANFLGNSQMPYLMSMINVSAVMEKDIERHVTGFFNLNNYDNSELIIQRQREIGTVQDELNEELHKVQKILGRPYLKYKDEVDYLIEVRNSQLKNLPPDWVKVNNTKMVSRFHTPNIIKLVERLRYHKDMLYNEAEIEYKRFLRKITEEYQLLKKFIRNIGTYDSLLALAATSCNANYVRPIFKEGRPYINAANARNPVIESLDVNYVSNDIKMSEKDGRVLIITGPNMGGKSSYVRQVALLVVLAQIGSFVPADHLELSVFDNIFTRIGAYDNLLRGESTFKVELLELMHIIKNCTSNSLLLLDEVGRGTSTEDGKAIAFTVLHYFLTLNECPFILFTTHYSMSGLPNPGMLRHYHMNFVEERKPGENWPSVVFLYKLKEGFAHNSYGLNVARLANLNKNIINRAYDISERMRADYERIQSLELSWRIREIISSSSIPISRKIAKLIDLDAK